METFNAMYFPLSTTWTVFYQFEYIVFYFLFCSMHLMFFFPPWIHVFFRNNEFSFQVLRDFPLSVNGFSFDSIMPREHTLGFPLFKIVEVCFMAQAMFDLGICFMGT